MTDDPVEPGKNRIIRRKTLQLNFRRLGDKYYQKSEEIRFECGEMGLSGVDSVSASAEVSAAPTVNQRRPRHPIIATMGWRGRLSSLRVFRRKEPQRHRDTEKRKQREDMVIQPIHRSRR